MTPHSQPSMHNICHLIAVLQSPKTIFFSSEFGKSLTFKNMLEKPIGGAALSWQQASCFIIVHRGNTRTEASEWLLRSKHCDGLDSKVFDSSERHCAGFR